MEFLSKDYTVASQFIYLLVVLSAIIFARYLFLSEAYKRFVYDRLKVHSPDRIVSPLYPLKQKHREIGWSLISSLLFGLIAVLMIMAWQRGYTKLYVQWDAYPLWQIPLSLVLGLAIHETYYYWLHRLLHHPKIFRHVHRIHHESVSTSVWTSFSFHPVESVLQAIIIPLIIMIIPMHIAVLIFLLLFMTITAIINHAGVEVYPGGWKNNGILKWLIGSTHHDLHHRLFVKNYGLYFTCWDKWMKTESEHRLAGKIRENPPKSA